MVFQRRDKKSQWRFIKETFLSYTGLKRATEYVWLRLKRRPGTPEFIAKGFALGILISFTPFLGIHVFGAIALAWVFSADAIAAVIATLLINAPITFGVIIPLTYRVGKAVLDIQPRFKNAQLDTAEEVVTKMWPIESWQHFLHVFWEMFLPMTIGGFITGIPIAFICYCVVKKAVILFKEKRRLIHQMRVKAEFNKSEADIEKDHSHDT